MSCEGCKGCMPLMNGLHRDNDNICIPLAQERFIYDREEYDYPIVALLGVTSSCNLSCTYCFVKQKPEQMTLEIAEKATEMVIANVEHRRAMGKECQPPTVIFFGGEPLLRFDDIIKPIVEKYRDRVLFSITTNGTLLDEDKVDFFRQNNIMILLSFDGIPTVQNTQRPAKEGNSFERTLKNIPYLLVRFPDTMMRGTITKASVPFLYESYLMAEEIGFKSTTYAINAFEEWDMETQKEFQHQLNLIATHILDKLMYTGSNEIPCRFEVFNHGLDVLRKMTYGGMYYPNELYRCGLGTSSFSVCPDGRIVPCQEKVSNPTWVIGDVQNGINPELHEKFLSWYWENINKFKCNRPCRCREDVQVFCMGRNICPSRLEDLNFTLPTSVCYATQSLYRVISRIFKLVDHSILPTFEKFFEYRERG